MQGSGTGNERRRSRRKGRHSMHAYRPMYDEGERRQRLRKTRQKKRPEGKQARGKRATQETTIHPMSPALPVES